MLWMTCSIDTVQRILRKKPQVRVLSDEPELGAESAQALDVLPLLLHPACRLLALLDASNRTPPWR
jgi:hypothetical protein